MIPRYTPTFSFVLGATVALIVLTDMAFGTPLPLAQPAPQLTETDPALNSVYYNKPTKGSYHDQEEEDKKFETLYSSYTPYSYNQEQEQNEEEEQHRAPSEDLSYRYKGYENADSSSYPPTYPPPLPPFAPELEKMKSMYPPSLLDQVAPLLW